jgi:drug/metabolite transporter (DMT)-like permease
LVKNGEDRLWTISIISLSGAFAAMPFAITLPPPSLESLPYIGLSALLQVGYSLFLVRAYEHGDLAQVYPIARGSAPLLVTIGAALFAGELPTPITLMGIALISLGIFALAIGKNSASMVAVTLALITGTFIAAYMLVDGLGVRVSHSATGYAA